MDDIRLPFFDEIFYFSHSSHVKALVRTVFYFHDLPSFSFDERFELGILWKHYADVEFCSVEVVQIINKKSSRAADVCVGQDVHYLNHSARSPLSNFDFTKSMSIVISLLFVTAARIA